MTSLATHQFANGLYRPGFPFTWQELQVLTHDGVLHCVRPGVYAEAQLPAGVDLRAVATSFVLSPGMRRRVVICGETAAWVHFGGTAHQETVTILTSGFYQRPNATYGPWRIYQYPFSDEEICQISGVNVTGYLRTAEDIFLGVGVHGRPESLHRVDRAEQRQAFQLTYWPQVAYETTESTVENKRRDLEQLRDVQRRLRLIASLQREADFSLDTLQHRVLDRLTIGPDGASASTRKQVETVLEALSEN